MLLERGGDRMPAKCLRMDDQGNLPTCTQYSDGSWVVDYPDAGGGPGGGFAALFVLVLLGGLAFTVWKVATARRMARDSGMSERDATAMALLTDDGFESTYLASNLRGQQAPTTTSTPRGSAADRLAELQTLRDRGLVTQDEYDAARRKIVDDL